MVFLMLLGCNQGQGKTLSKSPAKLIANLSWVAPSTYTDGSPISLSNIAGYNVYYGTTNGGPYTYQIHEPSLPTSATVLVPTRGTWYFVVTTVDILGEESAYSNQGSKTF
jgi:hypothetical protein